MKLICHFCFSNITGITATGIMVFLSDLLCNFGDGIAIGAAFSYSWPQGVGTSLAILFHELPREFGNIESKIAKTKL